VSDRLIVGAMLLALSTAGCPKLPETPEAPRSAIERLSDPGSKASALPLEDPKGRALLDEHLERADRRLALQGSARVLLDGPDFKLNRPQRIAVARPDRLRFEVLGLFDVLAALLVTDGDEFAFFDAATGDITRGAVTPDLLWELARLDLDPDEVVNLLLAAPKPSQGLEVVGLWRRAEGGLTYAFATEEARCSGSRLGRCGPSGIDLDRVFDRGLEVFEFDGTGRLESMESIGFDRRTRFRAAFEAYGGEVDGSQGVAFPMAMTVESPQVGATARFEWKRVALSSSLPERVFALPEAR
jgi:hypothetical protein